METTNNVSARNLIHTILLNEDTSVIADNIILNYLKQHPTIITKYINENGIYHVFYRTRDESTNPTKRKGNFIILLKSFTTGTEAKEWILQYGKDIVEEQENNYNRPIVLFIVHDKNKGIYEGDEPTNPHFISSHKYPVYAFSNRGYNMLLKEHIYLLGDDYHHNCNSYNSIPYWINYVRNKKLIQGVKTKDITKISEAYMRVDEETKKIYMDDIVLFQNEPQKYIDKHVKI